MWSTGHVSEFQCEKNTNTMVGLRTPFTPSLSISPSPSFSHSFPYPSSLSLKPQPFLSPKPQPLLQFASNNNNNNNSDLTENGKSQQQPTGSNDQQQPQENDNNWSKQKRPLFSFNWNALLDPEPDNVLALGLTGLLTWASVQVLWQLLFISLAILVAALKYSFIAALLVFILIALL